MDYNISYPNKATEKEILEKTPAAIMEEEITIGPAGSNKLIKGDNLPILKALTLNPEVIRKGSPDLY